MSLRTLSSLAPSRPRYRADGTIEYLGRIDHQVKIRGQRIELGEIEATLLRHPGIRQCVVLAREDMPGEKRLVAYLVVYQEQAPALAPSRSLAPDLRQDVRTFLQDHLPAYMIPTAFVVLDALPLTTSGKIDRRRLPEPEVAMQTPDEDMVAFRTPTEELLGQIWADVLAQVTRPSFGPISAQSNFFELGGHSLLAVQLLNRINQRFGSLLSLVAFLQFPTIAQIAPLLEQYHHGECHLRLLDKQRSSH